MLVDKNMPTDTTRVSLAEDWETRWWCDRFGCTETVLRRAVEEVGPAAAEVERKVLEAAKQTFKNTGED